MQLNKPQAMSMIEFGHFPKKQLAPRLDGKDMKLTCCIFPSTTVEGAWRSGSMVVCREGENGGE